VPAPPQLSARIEVPTPTVPAGGSLDGTLVVTNTGTEAVPLVDGDCGSHWAVYFRPGDLPAFPAICADPLVFPPGETRLPFAVPVARRACTPAEPHAGLPRCLPPPDVMPPLAPGDYRLALTAGPGLEAAEVPVVVTG